jgi:hypothetical protein
MRLTYGQLVSDSRITIPLNLNATDPRLLKYVNEACERIFWKGENFWGLTQRFLICVRNGCITLPRQIASMESIWLCGQPLQIRNQWFESLSSGPGLQQNCGNNGSSNTLGCGNNGFLFNWNGGWGNTYDRGTACTFRDIFGLTSKVRVYCDAEEAADAVIVIQGYDENKNWIRTEPDGAGNGWIDGEQIALDASTPQLSTKIFSSITGVQKPITNSNVRLYAYDTTDTTQLAIAIYEPSETLPVYRRIFIPNLECVPCCNTCPEDNEDDPQCCLKKITIIGRMEFIPAQVAADWILPACPSAIKDMVQSIRWMENNSPEQAAICEQRAMVALRSQLRHYLGHAIVQPVKMQPVNVAGPYVPAIW